MRSRVAQPHPVGWTRTLPPKTDTYSADVAQFRTFFEAETPTSELGRAEGWRYVHPFTS